MGLQIIILAAGSGTRMKSKTPKVLHQIGGIPMLERVVMTSSSLNPDQIHIIYGSGGDKVKSALDYLDVNWVYQEEQLGTAHAVEQAIPFCLPHDKILVLYADVPLISKETLQELLEQTDKGLSLIVASLENPDGLGRIVRNNMGHIVSVVEHKDASPEELKIKEINTGILCGRTDLVKRLLAKVENKNAQKEYYLPDIISFAVAEGVHVGGVATNCVKEVTGVNTRWQLAQLERYYQRQVAKQFCDSGVTVIDPDRLDVRGNDINIAQDVTLEANILLDGTIEIGEGCHIGPNVVLRNTKLGENVKILPHSVVEGAVIANDVSIGPFARIRPTTFVASGAKIGNFVEVKNAKIAAGVKAGHLSYLGDAEIGEKVNIGAGTITCNYDGINKHKTKIGAGAFIGSNTSLVAPVNIGAKATIGAGSVISKDAPAGQLTLTRASQKTIAGWQAPELLKA